MKFLRSCAKFHLTRRHKAIRPCTEIFCITTLAGLPPELLWSIFDLLPLADLLCLSLCNRRLFELTRRQIDRLAPVTQEDKLTFLSRLERDLPEYFACDICNLLHPYDGSESFGLSGLPHERASKLPCVRAGRTYLTSLETDKWFNPAYTLKTHP